MGIFQNKDTEHKIWILLPPQTFQPLFQNKLIDPDAKEDFQTLIKQIIKWKGEKLPVYLLQQRPHTLIMVPPS